MLTRRIVLGGALAVPVLAGGAARTPYAAAAEALIDHILHEYAYRERLAGFSETRLREMRGQADAVGDETALLEFGERAIAAIFDHHAIMNTGRSAAYGLVPSFSDIWIEKIDDAFMVTSVRRGSPAARAGVEAGERLTHVAGAPIERAIQDYIDAPLSALAPDQQASCALMLAAGRRDRPRDLTFSRRRRGQRRLRDLANLYAEPIARQGALSTQRRDDAGVITINDSLGDAALVEAFAQAVNELRNASRIVIDLRDTGSGGNTYAARGVMGWFVDRPTPYQRHELTAESLDTGVRRSWIEEVSPLGETYRGRVIVLVGRWTASMGEGLAVGFDAIGASVVGSRMAGLRGGVYNLSLPNTRVQLVLPVERIDHIDGTRREDFAPGVHLATSDAASEGDPAMAVALAQN